MLPRSEVFRLENRIAGCKCILRGKCAVKQKFREMAGTHWAAPGMTSSSSGHYLMSKPGGEHGMFFSRKKNNWIKSVFFPRIFLITQVSLPSSIANLNIQRNKIKIVRTTKRYVILCPAVC